MDLWGSREKFLKSWNYNKSNTTVKDKKVTMTSLSIFNKTESQLLQYLSLCLGQSDKTHPIPPLTANEWEQLLALADRHEVRALLEPVWDNWCLTVRPARAWNNTGGNSVWKGINHSCMAVWTFRMILTHTSVMTGDHRFEEVLSDKGGTEGAVIKTMWIVLTLLFANYWRRSSVLLLLYLIVNLKMCWV